MWNQFPVEIIRLIFEYDPTYRQLYSQIVQEQFHYLGDGPYRINPHTGHRQLFNSKGELEWEGNFRKGYYEGPLRSYFHQQLLREGYYHQGRLHGPYCEYYKNGQLLVEKFYVEGLQEGFMNHYFENGNLFQKCFYQQGKRHGPFLLFGRDGVLREVRLYKRDKIWKRFPPPMPCDKRRIISS